MRLGPEDEGDSAAQLPLWLLQGRDGNSRLGCRSGSDNPAPRHLCRPGPLVLGKLQRGSTWEFSSVTRQRLAHEVSGGTPLEHRPLEPGTGSAPWGMDPRGAGSPPCSSDARSCRGKRPSSSGRGSLKQGGRCGRRSGCRPNLYGAGLQRQRSIARSQPTGPAHQSAGSS